MTTSRRTFLTFGAIGAGVLAFGSPALALAPPHAGPAAGATGEPADRVPNYVGGTVLGVRSRQIQLRSIRGTFILRLSSTSQVWKGSWNSGATIDVGDRIDARGTPQSGGYFDVERMWVNITNLIGPVSSFHESGDILQLTQRDRFVGPRAVTIDRQTTITAKSGERLYVPGEFPLAEGEVLQVIGLQLKDGSIRATRVFT